MPLHENNRLLAEALERLPLLDGRFRDMKLVNFDSASDQKRGCLSLVFRAYDTVEEAEVALKFYDLDPGLASDMYRLASFHRECEILSRLLNVARCLQIVKAMGSYNLVIDLAPGSAVTLGCRYFAVEWIADDIDDYFLKQETFQAIEKLRLFKDIVLAVEALHKHDVFHRDLKVDNLREYEVAGTRSVVAIDLGTAARLDSAPIAVAYGTQVGARAYASPEAICGLAGIRDLGPVSDTYALGCLLYELFNRDLFYQALRACNTNFDARLAAMGLSVPKSAPAARQLAEWKDSLAVLAVGVTCPQIDGLGTSTPSALGPLLNPLLSSLTHTDFRKRPTLELVRRTIWSAITLLKNEQACRLRVSQMRARRQRRLAKLAAKEQRLLGNPMKSDCGSC